MMRHAIRFTFAVATLLMTVVSSQAQNDDPGQGKNKPATEKKEAKPYKILTAGKRITIQSKNNIKRVLVWTSSGHRIVEQHELDVSSYTFNITINEKVFFLMLETQDGNRYSEKFGIQ